ncbi:hypothetical protein PB1_15564 [Bacillus methanolicus PB1]|uniref:Uncharacterized protein n=1 Tax=Bacillus methanolicus PB1 TaxID=997296 RepID=I3DXL8_BACMT|nr:hypothetical protein PB1_15564 [Bacillus methanolicus PB1]
MSKQGFFVLEKMKKCKNDNNCAIMAKAYLHTKNLDKKYVYINDIRMPAVYRLMAKFFKK